MSCAFEIPDEILRHVKEDGLDLSQACNASGITRDPKLGEHGGLIGILTHGRVDRGIYTRQALACALICVEQRQWY
jgi:non-canonical (house-cleaning) NTP pyrophosphatase